MCLFDLILYVPVNKKECSAIFDDTDSEDETDLADR